MNTNLEEARSAADGTEALRLKLAQCQRELERSRIRMGELGQTEALLAGENRLLEMVASGCSLPEILNALCRLIEEISSNSLCGPKSLRRIFRIGLRLFRVLRRSHTMKAK